MSVGGSLYQNKCPTIEVITQWSESCDVKLKANKQNFLEKESSRTNWMCFSNYSTWISREIYQTPVTIFNLLQMLKGNIIHIAKTVFSLIIRKLFSPLFCHISGHTETCYHSPRLERLRKSVYNVHKCSS